MLNSQVETGNVTSILLEDDKEPFVVKVPGPVETELRVNRILVVTGLPFGQLIGGLPLH